MWQFHLSNKLPDHLRLKRLTRHQWREVDQNFELKDRFQSFHWPQMRQPFD